MSFGFANNLSEFTPEPQFFNGAVARVGADGRNWGWTVPAGQTGTMTLMQASVALGDLGHLLAGRTVRASFGINTSDGYSQFRVNGATFQVSRPTDANLSLATTVDQAPTVDVSNPNRRFFAFSAIMDGTETALKPFFRRGNQAPASAEQFILVTDLTLEIVASPSDSLTLLEENRYAPAWTSIICADPNEDALMYYELPDDAPALTIRNTQLLWPVKHMVIIEGGTWKIKKGRYPFHTDSFGDYPMSEQRIINVVAEHLGNLDAIYNDWNQGSQIAFGSGTSDGQIMKLIDTVGIGPGGGFSVHGPNGPTSGGQVIPWKTPWVVDLDGCVFHATSPTRPDVNIVPVSVGPGRVSLRSCQLETMNYTDGQWVGGDPGPDVNTAQIAVVAASCTPFAFTNAITKGAASGATYQPRIVGAGA